MASSTLLQGGESLAADLHLPLVSVQCKQFLRISPPLALPNGADTVDLLAISSNTGLLAVATGEGSAQPLRSFILHPAHQLRKVMRDAPKGFRPELKEPWRRIFIPKTDSAVALRFLKFAQNQSSITAGLSDGRVLLWRLVDIEAGRLEPEAIIAFGQGKMLALAPNTSASAHFVVVLKSESDASSHEGQVHLIDLNSRISTTLNPNLLGAKVTALSWSVKGKQLALGLSDGQIVQITPEDGVVKARLPRPPSPELSSKAYVSDIFWIENEVFIVAYNVPSQNGCDEPPHEDALFVLSRSRDGTLTHTAISDPSPAFGLTQLRSRRYVAHLKGWSPWRNQLYIANAPSTDVGLVARREEDENWETLELLENSRPTLPFSSVDKCSETAPLGMVLDAMLPMDQQSDEDEKPTDPNATARGDVENTKLRYVPPTLWLLDSDGSLGAWSILNLDQRGASGFPYMVRAESSSDVAILNATKGITDGSLVRSLKVNEQAAAISPAKSSTFGTAATGNGLTTSASPSGISSAFSHSSAWGQTPAFGQPSAFGKNASPNSPFRTTLSTSSATSTFGTPWAFGSASTKSSFSDGFGTPSVFGTKAGVEGTKYFGPSTAGSGPAFGSTSAFGKPSAFGPTPSHPDPSASPFGQPSGFGCKPSTSFSFGQTGISGSSNTSSSGGFGSFVSTPSRGGFGAFAKKEEHSNSIFGGSTASGTSSRFGGFSVSSQPKTGGESVFGSGGSLSSLSQASPNRPFGQAVKAKPPAPPNSGEKNRNAQDSYTGASFVFGCLGNSLDDKQKVNDTAKSSVDGNAEEKAAASSVPHESTGTSSAFSFAPLAPNVQPVKPNLSPSMPVASLDSKPTPTLNFGKDPAASVNPVQLPARILATPDHRSDDTSNNRSVSFASSVRNKPSTFSATSADGSKKPFSFANQGASTGFGFDAVCASKDFSFESSQKASESTPSYETESSKISPNEKDDSAEECSLKAATVAGLKTVAKGSTEPVTEKDEDPARPYIKLEGSDGKGLPQVKLQASKAPSIENLVESSNEPLGTAMSKPHQEPEILQTALSASYASTMGILPTVYSPAPNKIQSSAPIQPPTPFSFNTKGSDRVKRAPPRHDTQSANLDFFLGGRNLKNKSSPRASPKEMAASAEMTCNASDFDPTGASASPRPIATDSPGAVAVTGLISTDETNKAPAAGGTGDSNVFGGLNQRPSAKPGRSPPLADKPFGFSDLPDSLAKKQLFGSTAAVSAPTNLHGSRQAPSPRNSVLMAGSKPVFSSNASRSPGMTASESPTPSFSFTPAKGSRTSAAMEIARKSSSSVPTASISPPPEDFATPISISSQSVQQSRAQFPFNSRTPPNLRTGDVSQLQPGEVEENGLQGEFLKTYLIMEKELVLLKTNIEKCSAFQTQVRESSGEINASSDLHYTDSWSFGDLSTLTRVSEELNNQVQSLKRDVISQFQDVGDLETNLLKAEAKREEAARLLRAHTDPEFAKLIRVRHLGPEHAQNQTKLRILCSSVGERVKELESFLHNVRLQVRDERLGKLRMKTPSIDAIQRTVKNMSATAAKKNLELDHLLTEFELLRRREGAGVAKGRSRTFSRRPSVFFGVVSGRDAKLCVDRTDVSAIDIESPSSSLMGLGASLDRSLPASSGCQRRGGSIKVSAAVREAVREQQNSNEILQALLTSRKEPILNQSAFKNYDTAQSIDGRESSTVYRASDLQMVFAKGPIKVSALKLKSMNTLPSFGAAPAQNSMSTVSSSDDSCPVELVTPFSFAAASKRPQAATFTMPTSATSTTATTKPPELPAFSIPQSFSLTSLPGSSAFQPGLAINAQATTNSSHRRDTSRKGSGSSSKAVPLPECLSMSNSSASSKIPSDFFAFKCPTQNTQSKGFASNFFAKADSSGLSSNSAKPSKFSFASVAPAISGTDQPKSAGFFPSPLFSSAGAASFATSQKVNTAFFRTAEGQESSTTPHVASVFEAPAADGFALGKVGGLPFSAFAATASSNGSDNSGTSQTRSETLPRGEAADEDGEKKEKKGDGKKDGEDENEDITGQDEAEFEDEDEYPEWEEEGEADEGKDEDGLSAVDEEEEEEE